MKRLLLIGATVSFYFLCMSVDADNIWIISATYGVGNKQEDVAPQLKNMYVTHGGRFINFTVRSKFLKKTPAPGIRKALTMTYKIGNSYRNVTYPDKTRVLIVPGVRLTDEFSLGKAYYGAKNSWIDVTDYMSKAIKNNEKFIVNNDIFGSNPCKGVHKKLCIFYSEGKMLKYKYIHQKKEFSTDVFNSEK